MPISFSIQSPFKRIVVRFAIGFAALLVWDHSLHAQSALTEQMRAITNQSIGIGYSINSINQQILSQDRARVSGNIGTSIGVNGGQRAEKPFTNVSNRPTVSPYLNLFNEGFSDGIDNYNTLVRPQIEQQRTNAQFRRQNDQLRRQEQSMNVRFQSLTASPAFNPGGNQNIFSTGHRTLFNNTLQYYPQARR